MKKGEPRSARASSKQGALSSERALKRSNSQPDHLSSNPKQPAEVKTARRPITRPTPDTKPVEGFIFEEAAGGRREGAEIKKVFMEAVDKSNHRWELLQSIVERNPDYIDFLKSVHPKYDKYDWKQKEKAYDDIVKSHPGLRAEMAKMRNDLHAVPNHSTSHRWMEPYEQKFLTKAMQRIKEDVEKKPFHIHGESAIVGIGNGEIRWFGHNPAGSISYTQMENDRFALHNHRPFMEPFTSSASELDHAAAAHTYLVHDSKMNNYVTTGKKVYHIPPASMELVELRPDPGLERVLGKFPEAFRLPDLQQTPRPFSNFEAPAALNKVWEPPAGWAPDPDYPRTEFFNKKVKQPADRKPPKDTPSAQAEPRPDSPVNPSGFPSATRSQGPRLDKKKHIRIR